MKDIVNHINSLILALGILPKDRIHGVCEQMRKQSNDGEQVFPAQFVLGSTKPRHLPKGEYAYHRQVAPATQSRSDTVINGIDRTWPMRMGALIFRSRYKGKDDAYLPELVASTFANAITLTLPTIKDCDDNGIKWRVREVFVERINSDRHTAWIEEFQNIGDEPGFDKIFFTLDYIITASGGVDCLPSACD